MRGTGRYGINKVTDAESHVGTSWPSKIIQARRQRGALNNLAALDTGTLPFVFVLERRFVLDQIVVMPGTYNEAVSIKAGGTAAANLTLKSQVPYGARIRSPSASYSAINIQKSYVTVDGFDVQGGGTGHGIEATYLDGNIAKPGPHHLKIINNVCHDNAGSGISVSYGDYYLIEKTQKVKIMGANSYQIKGKF